MPTELIKALKDFLSCRLAGTEGAATSLHTIAWPLPSPPSSRANTAAKLVRVDGKGPTDRRVTDPMASEAKPQALTLLLVSLSSSEGLQRLRQPGSAPPPPSPAKARGPPHPPPGYLFGPFMGKKIILSQGLVEYSAYPSRLQQKELDPCPQTLLVIGLSCLSPPPTTLLFYGVAAAAERGVRSQGKDNLTDGAQVVGSA